MTQFHYSLSTAALAVAVVSSIALAQTSNSSTANQQGPAGGSAAGTVGNQPGGEGNSGNGSGSNTGGSAAQQALITLHDTEAIHYIQHLNQKEINDANNAAAKLQSTQLQTVNQTILQDHENSLTQTQTLAGTLNITVAPFQESDWEQVVDSALAQIQTGTTFDQAYVGEEKTEHQIAIQIMQQMQGESHSPQVSLALVSAINLARKHLALVTIGNVSTNASPTPSPSASPSASPSTGTRSY